MIILDTNVLSALMQQLPDPQVVVWLDQQPGESVWLTSITVFVARAKSEAAHLHAPHSGGR